MRKYAHAFAGDAEINLVEGRIRGGESRRRWSQEQLLLQAVLEDAARCFLSSNRRLRDEAETWMSYGEGQDPSLISFYTVCEALNLDPAAVKAALKKMRHSELRARRVRVNVRRTSVLTPVRS